MFAAVEALQPRQVLFEREVGLPHLRIVALTEGAPIALAASHRIEFDEPAYNASVGENPEFRASHVRFQYESFVTPRTIFDYDVGTRERILRKQQPVLGDYDPARYVSERLHATASDGTRVPLSIVYRRYTRRDGCTPLPLYCYCSYRIPSPIHFPFLRPP